MGRAVEFSGVFIRAKIAACSHSCKYCLMGEKRLARFSTERFSRFVLRFLEWGARNGVAVDYTLNYSDEYDSGSLDLLAGINTRFPRKYPLGGITLGGLRQRSGEEMRAWLIERRRYGCRTVHASFAGLEGTHDHWNGRAGNFDFLMRSLRVAGELGMGVGARLFVVKSTLGQLDELRRRLDGLPKNENNWRYAAPFFYLGWGARFEAERIDERIRDVLPAWLNPLITCAQRQWRSEREWVEVLRGRREEPARLALDVELTDENIARLEAMDCAAVVAEFDARARSAYAALPALSELCERYGDRHGTLIYELERCIEGKWLDRHLAEHPTAFERRLTHLQLG